MSIVTVGIDLAKNIFAVHGVDENGKAVLIKPKVLRDQLLLLIAKLPPCLIGLEACSGAHYWARLFRTHGHSVKLIAPKFVTPERYPPNGARTAEGAALFRPTGRWYKFQTACNTTQALCQSGSVAR